MDIVNFYNKQYCDHRKLLITLYSTPFRWTLPTDASREVDGRSLRYLFDPRFDELKTDSSNILEVLIALAVRCEDDIMQDEEKGDRTELWFWLMISHLGLWNQTDSNYDESFVEDKLDMFLDRKYGRSGIGSIFYTTRSDRDFRYADLWYQMVWYLDEQY